MSSIKRFFLVLVVLPIFSLPLTALTLAKDLVPEIKVPPQFFLKAPDMNPTDVALWINPLDAAQSMVIGNDHAEQGSLIGWTLEGTQLFRVPAHSPINFDVQQSVELVKNEKWDLLGVAVQKPNAVQFYKVDPITRTIENISAQGEALVDFSGDINRLALYRRPQDGACFIFVSSSKRGEPVKQYRLLHDGAGKIRIQKEREIHYPNWLVQGITADNTYHHVYISDEKKGVLKFAADPEKLNNSVLATFPDAAKGMAFSSGIAIYACANGKGFILLSNKTGQVLDVFNRVPPHEKITQILTEGGLSSDGMDATSHVLNDLFKRGAVVLHNKLGKNYTVYNWNPIYKQGLSCEVFMNIVL